VKRGMARSVTTIWLLSEANLQVLLKRALLNKHHSQRLYRAYYV
jgi:hypothetical protein